jgi:hypothetical protein
MPNDHEDDGQGRLLLQQRPGLLSAVEREAANRTGVPETDLQGEGVYKRHRIHVSELQSRRWLAAAVHFGARDSGVECIKGEYATKAEAIAAAKRHVDQEAITQQGDDRRT